LYILIDPKTLSNHSYTPSTDLSHALYSHAPFWLSCGQDMSCGQQYHRAIPNSAWTSTSLNSSNMALGRRPMHNSNEFVLVEVRWGVQKWISCPNGGAQSDAPFQIFTRFLCSHATSPSTLLATIHTPPTLVRLPKILCANLWMGGLREANSIHATQRHHGTARSTTATVTS
jgi:hypothetical protein